MSDWAAVASALFAAVGLIFTGRQLLLLNQQTQNERRLGVEGVVVSWRAAEVPAHAGNDGSAVWKYEISISNPGRFPTDHIEIRWVFSCLVQRLHHAGEPDPPSNELRMSTPVLAGGGERHWTRRLRLNFAEAGQALTDTYAEVTFDDISRQRRTNRWPRTAAQ